MYRADVSSWNLRDRHMAATLDALVDHLDHLGQSGRSGHRSGRTKVVVWAHNSHLGDARATSMSARGELNVGQLARQRYGSDAVLVGFTTFDGSVTAASDWGAPARRKLVRPGRPDSYEALLHAVGLPQFWVAVRDAAVRDVLGETRLERAIGVIYSMPSSTWTTPEPSNPWSAARCGSGESRPRHTRPGYEMPGRPGERMSRQVARRSRC